LSYKPVVIAVLDWELASIGDPMMDLAYTCMIYHYPEEIKVIFPNHNNGM
jgi:aminoglycoside phosphotransferase (APT) family kinase protein